MGVIKRDDSRVGLFNSPSEESLHIPQSSEDERSVTSQDDHPPQFSPAAPRNRPKLPVPTYFFNAKKRLGKKKSRHHANVVSLMTLVEEEELGEVTINDLVPDSSTWGFSQIFNDAGAFQAWDVFINSTEERQDQILQENAVRPIQRSKPTPPDRQLTGEEAFMNIKTGIRNKLKKTQIPQGMLGYLEENLVEFFTQDPNRTYISESISSFERLLLHAISQYHRLISFSIDSAAENARLVQVHNPHHNVFQVPTLLLGQYLDERKKAACH